MYTLKAAVNGNRTFQYSTANPVILFSDFTKIDAVLIPTLAIGIRRWPRTIVSSWNCFFALSTSACTVLFCVSNSSITEVAFSYAVAAVSCLVLMSSILSAMVVSTAVARVPSRFISWNIFASVWKFPFLLRESRKSMTAPLASFLSFSWNSSNGMPAILANVFVSVVILVSS